MPRKLFSLGVVCVLLVMIQTAVSQDSNVAIETCPSLSDESVRVLCQSETGPIRCADAQVGNKARAFWRKTVISASQRAGDSTLVCQSPGVWVLDKMGNKNGNSTRTKEEEKAMWKEARKRNDSTTQGGNSTSTITTITPATLAVTTRPGLAPPGYVRIEGFGLYKYYKSDGNSDEANITCRNEGSRLLIVDSMSEMLIVHKTLLLQNLDNFRGKGLFLGVRINQQMRFMSDLGAPFPGSSGLAWGSNEPSMRADEGCVFIDVPTFVAHDMACRGHAANFVCERPLK